MRQRYKSVYCKIAVMEGKINFHDFKILKKYLQFIFFQHKYVHKVVCTDYAYSNVCTTNTF